MNMRLLYIIVCAGTTASLSAAILTVNFKPYPDAIKLVSDLKNPITIAHHTLIRITQTAPVSGIFAVYAGYLHASNRDGVVTFPRKQTNTELFMLITPQIEPVLMFPQTVDHWRLVPSVPAQFFKAQRTNDQETQLSYWLIEDAPLPADNKIPTETLTVLANPGDIFVPTGVSLSDGGPNLLLPPLYTRKTLDVITSSLFIVNLAHLFGPVEMSITKKETYFAEQPMVQ